MRVTLVVLLIMTTGSLGAAATNAADLYRPHYGAQAEELKLDLNYFKGYFSDAGSMLASPLSWGGSDWLKFSAVVAATIAFSSEEEDVQTWVQDSRNDDTNMVSQFAGPLGSARYTLPVLCALYGYGRIAGSDRATRTALLSFESVIISGVFSGVIKYLTHKHRPGPAITDDIPWSGPSFSHAHLSFPSGHSTCGFAVATIVASEYGDYALVPPLAYCAAALAALSRVNDNSHWLSDIILGSAIGHFTARAIVGGHRGGARGGLSLVPAARDGSVGLALSYKF